ncbi:MAG TPA: CCA tRNA nucleotidyltransferase, partial [Acidobacteriota bacterium]|nr:CCA tRNA nucleotidyltransferase [Acidobacteriota bacterium]
MKKGAIRIIRKLRLHGYEALFAGGFVRDLIMGRKSEDIDIATSALPDEVGQLFPGSIKTGARFGVIQAPMYGRFYEVTTFRSDDMYLDGRRPVSVSFSGPRQDALRRDFTVNGMFYDPEEERLIDFVGGRRDIRRKRIRTIGDPVKRFAEDKLRIMRAIRLSCSLEFTIVNETLTAIKQFAPDITQVSRERIRDELIKILTGPHPDAGVRLLHECGLLPHIVPEIASRQYVKKLGYVRSGAEALARTIFALSLLRKPSEALAFAALLHTIVEPSAANGLPEKPAGTSLPI